jgi:hypothetical protein
VRGDVFAELAARLDLGTRPERPAVAQMDREK